MLGARQLIVQLLIFLCFSFVPTTDAQRQLQANPAPAALWVSVPSFPGATKEAAACAGQYSLLAGVTGGGWPVWQRGNGTAWLYSATSGAWAITTSSKVPRSNFSSALGDIATPYQHGPRMPDAIGNGWWEYYDGAYRANSLITVTSSPPVTNFTVQSGPCSVDSQGCVTSPNFPSTYGSNQSCQILVGRPGYISSSSFDTEAQADFLTISGRIFSGSNGPQNVLCDQFCIIAWASDSDIVRSGWRLCLAITESRSEGPAPAGNAPPLDSGLSGHDHVGWIVLGVLGGLILLVCYGLHLAGMARMRARRVAADAAAETPETKKTPEALRVAGAEEEPSCPQPPPCPEQQPGAASPVTSGQTVPGSPGRPSVASTSGGGTGDAQRAHEAGAHGSSTQDPGRRIKVMLSGRFSIDWQIKRFREVEEVLKDDYKDRLEVLCVPGNVGVNFGLDTMRNLVASEVLVAMCFENYGVRTGCRYCTYDELEYAHTKEKPIVPVKLYRGGWPPPALLPDGTREENGRIQNEFVFKTGLAYLDMSTEPWDPQLCADKIARACIECTD